MRPPRSPTSPASWLLGLCILLGLIGSAQAATTLGFCTAGGGTLGTNLFANDGTFGTLSGTPANPTWAAALPAGVTTLKYINNTIRTSPWTGSPEDGEYTISNSTAFRTDGAWWNFTDHTGSASGAPSGNLKDLMMVINASYTADTFYQQTFTVTPNTNYEYGLWIMNMLKGGGIAPNIQVEVDRIVGGTTLPTQIVAKTGDIPVSNPATWKAYGSIINSGAATQMTVRFKNINPGGGGNDLAIDDLTFTTCNGLNIGSLSGTVYLDNNRNNTLDVLGTDTAQAGVTVQLVNSAGSVTTSAVTDSNGYYVFYNVPAATYTVRVQPSDPNINATYVATAPAGAQRGGVVIGTGAFVTDQNFGYQQGVDVQAIKTQRLGTSGTFASTDLTAVPQFSAVQYQLTLKNSGTVAITSTSTLTDAIPAGLTAPSIGSTTAAGGATGCTPTLSGNTFTLTAATLPVGASCTTTVQVTSSTIGTFTNTATANPPTGIPDYASGNNTSASVKLTVPPVPRVTVAKRSRNIGPVGAFVTSGAFTTTATPISVKPLDVIEYCLDFNNAAGLQNAHTVVVRDVLPTSVTGYADGYGTGLGLSWSRTISGVTTSGTFTSASGDDAGDLSSTNEVWRVGDLNSGDSGSVCFRAVVK